MVECVSCNRISVRYYLISMISIAKRLNSFENSSTFLTKPGECLAGILAICREALDSRLGLLGLELHGYELNALVDDNSWTRNLGRQCLLTKYYPKR